MGTNDNNHKRRRAEQRASEKGAHVSLSSQDADEGKKKKDAPADTGQKPKEKKGLRMRVRELLKRPSLTDYAIAFFTLVLAIVSYLQWRELNTAALSTQKEFEFTQKQVVNEQEAVVGIEVDFLPQGVLDITAINQGRSPARNVHFSFQAARYSLPDYGQIGSALSTQQWDINNLPPPGQPGRPMGGTSERQYLIPGFNLRKDLSDLSETRQTIKIVGNLRYDNGFGDTVTEPFCRSWLAYTVRDTNGKPISTVSQFWPCEGFDARVATALQNQQDAKNPN
ncbi:MAG: hypothetical protein ABSA85_04730 [Terracidiphilus sp.]|jgi:hypothetical protein